MPFSMRETVALLAVMMRPTASPDSPRWLRQKRRY